MNIRLYVCRMEILLYFGNIWKWYKILFWENTFEHATKLKIFVVFSRVFVKKNKAA